MKSLTAILLCSLVFLCMVQACSALSSSGSFTTTPSLTALSGLQPGYNGIEVSGTILLPQSGDLTFNPDDTVDFYTQLNNANWSVSIILNGIANPAMTFGGAHADITGYSLSYPTSNYNQVALQFSLTEGAVPSSFPSGDIILVRAMELDSNSNQVGDAVYVNGTIFNPSELNANIATANTNLANLKADIDAKSGMGVDVSIAQQDYNAANAALNSASNAVQSSPTTVQSYIDSASNYITQGSSDLDQAWANQSIQQANTMLASVDGLITEFQVNDSLQTSDSRLVAIINKRDLAAQSISSANDQFTTGQYDTARADATNGLSLANQAWNLSLTLKAQIGPGFKFGLPNLGSLLPIFIVIVVVLLVVGVIVYRRRSRWDELG